MPKLEASATVVKPARSASDALLLQGLVLVTFCVSSWLSLRCRVFSLVLPPDEFFGLPASGGGRHRKAEKGAALVVCGGLEGSRRFGVGLLYPARGQLTHFMQSARERAACGVLLLPTLDARRPVRVQRTGFPSNAPGSPSPATARGTSRPMERRVGPATPYLYRVWIWCLLRLFLCRGLRWVGLSDSLDSKRIRCGMIGSRSAGRSAGGSGSIQPEPPQKKHESQSSRSRGSRVQKPRRNSRQVKAGWFCGPGVTRLRLQNRIAAWARVRLVCF